jgi:hypothetical protein
MITLLLVAHEAKTIWFPSLAEAAADAADERIFVIIEHGV